MSSRPLRDMRCSSMSPSRCRHQKTAQAFVVFGLKPMAFEAGSPGSSGLEASFAFKNFYPVLFDLGQLEVMAKSVKMLPNMMMGRLAPWPCFCRGFLGGLLWALSICWCFIISHLSLIPVKESKKMKTNDESQVNGTRYSYFQYGQAIAALICVAIMHFSDEAKSWSCLSGVASIEVMCCESEIGCSKWPLTTYPLQHASIPEQMDNIPPLTKYLVQKSSFSAPGRSGRTQEPGWRHERELEALHGNLDAWDFLHRW